MIEGFVKSPTAVRQAHVKKPECPALPHGASSLNIVQFRDLAEMMAVNRKGDGQGEQVGTAENRPEKHLPILESLSAKNTESDT
jgi:hypothetical protein